MLKIILFSGLLVMTGALSSCSSDNSQQISSEGSSIPNVSVRSVKTTPSDLALNNLNSQMTSLQKLIADEPILMNNLRFRSQLLDRIQTKTLYVGSFNDFFKARSLIQESQNTKEQLLLNFTYHMMVHEYDLAFQVLEKLSSIPSMSDTITGLRATLFLARGENLDQAEDWMQEIVSQNPSYSDYLRLAGIQREQGALKESLNTFSKSLESYRNTSPFPPAYTHFQIGLIYGEYMDAPKLAKEHYRIALNYLPEYVKPRVHLSEFLIKEGKTTEALDLMMTVEDSQDPEVPAILAKIYSELGHQTKSLEYVAIATQRYQELLKDFELAFADHGAEFFMSVGNNPSLALDLARKNLANRKSDRAYDLVKRAEEANRN